MALRTPLQDVVPTWVHDPRANQLVAVRASVNLSEGARPIAAHSAVGTRPAPCRISVVDAVGVDAAGTGGDVGVPRAVGCGAAWARPAAGAVRALSIRVVGVGRALGAGQGAL
eukprot:318816-Rhodomonas_salina.1